MTVHLDAVNGPVAAHSERALLRDIVPASDGAILSGRRVNREIGYGPASEGSVSGYGSRRARPHADG